MKWFGILLVFILTEHCMAAWRYEISLLNIPTTLEEKFEEKSSAVSPCGHVLSYPFNITRISQLYQIGQIIWFSVSLELYILIGIIIRILISP